MVYSDGRFKKNIKENVAGLEFITQLRPVTYTYDIHALNKHMAGNSAPAETVEKGEVAAKVDEEAIANKEKKIYSGFIAQEVEATAKKLNYDFSGVYKPENDEDVYGLSYSDFIVPLVKAAQEQQSQIQDLKAKNEEFQIQINDLKTLISKSSNSTITTSLNGYLKQNIPNPSNNNTVISYYTPDNTRNAQILVTDMKGGVLKAYTVSRGQGQVNISNGELPSGTYNYTLYVNSVKIDTKQMIVIK